MRAEIAKVGFCKTETMPAWASKPCSKFCDPSVTSANVRPASARCPIVREELADSSRQIGANYVYVGQINCLRCRKSAQSQLPRTEPPLISSSGGLDHLI